MPRNVKCKNCLNLHHEHHWCEKVIDSPDEELVRDCRYFCQMTIADRIRAMNDDELRNFLCGLMNCSGCAFGTASGCKLKEWLQAPSKEKSLTKDDGEKTDSGLIEEG